MPFGRLEALHRLLSSSALAPSQWQHKRLQVLLPISPAILLTKMRSARLVVFPVSWSYYVLVHGVVVRTRPRNMRQQFWRIWRRMPRTRTPFARPVALMLLLGCCAHHLWHTTPLLSRWLALWPTWPPIIPPIRTLSVKLVASLRSLHSLKFLLAIGWRKVGKMQPSRQRERFGISPPTIKPTKMLYERRTEFHRWWRCYVKESLRQHRRRQPAPSQILRPGTATRRPSARPAPCPTWLSLCAPVKHPKLLNKQLARYVTLRPTIPPTRMLYAKQAELRR
mmetsp:Transcript_4786/g.12749  ORF Transcript_4786/g.12749 Transcript_4786/m.12749 type:complete len:280 (-) Transcript_4786:1476-2315(-)